MEITGLDQLKAKLDKIAAGIGDASGKGLYQVGETIMTASKRQAPVKTGNLRASGTVDQPVTSGAKATVKLHYDAPYALFVHEGHEIVAWGHDTGRRSAPSKFLESPMTAAQSHLADDLAKPIGAEIERLAS